MSIFKNLIGHRINGILLGNDRWTIVFRTIDGKYFRYDTDNDCCNSVYINHIAGVQVIGKGDSFDLLRGALVTAAEDKQWTANRQWTEADGGQYGDVIQDGFYTIYTDRGYIDIEVRNNHNGYYGGSFGEVDAELSTIDDLLEITEDF